MASGTQIRERHYFSPERGLERSAAQGVPQRDPIADATLMGVAAGRSGLLVGSDIAALEQPPPNSSESECPGRHDECTRYRVKESDAGICG